MKQKTLTRLAMMLVILLILDYASRTVKIFPTPNGGTLSFVPLTFAIVAIIAKPLEGLLFGSVASLFTFMIGSQWFVSPIQWLFDYPIAIGGAIMIGSVLWMILDKTRIPYMVRVGMTTLSITLFQFVSYSIALLAYLPTSGIKGIGNGFGADLVLIMKYNAIYMVPIIIANTITSALIFPRIKIYLKRQ